MSAQRKKVAHPTDEQVENNTLNDIQMLGIRRKWPNAGFILRQFAQGDYARINVVPHGEGKQIIFDLTVEEFADMTDMCATFVRRIEEDPGSDLKAETRILVMTGFFSINSVMRFFINNGRDVTRNTMLSWQAVRRSNFPMARVGGVTSPEVVYAAQEYWQRKKNGKPASLYPFKELRKRNGTACIGRLLGMKGTAVFNELRKNIPQPQDDDYDTTDNQPLNIDHSQHSAGDHSGSTGIAESGDDGHHQDGGEVSTAVPSTAVVSDGPLNTTPVPLDPDDPRLSWTPPTSADLEADDSGSGQPVNTASEIPAGTPVLDFNRSASARRRTRSFGSQDRD